MFLDELPEFQKSVLETLRQPLENHSISISRAQGTFEYPASFQLVCAMNPCSCGYFPDRNRCSCSVSSVRKYLGKISRPLLDRIDICVEAPRITFRDLRKDPEAETSKTIRKRVEKAHEIQRERYRGLGVRFNSQLDGAMTERFCALDEEQKSYMGKVFETMELTARGYYKILKVARTIADLRGDEIIVREDLSEAIAYRGVDEKYFGEV